MAAIINPLGQIEKKIDYDESGYIAFNNRVKLEITMYSTYGNTIVIAIILLYIFLIF